MNAISMNYALRIRLTSFAGAVTALVSIALASTGEAQTVQALNRATISRDQEAMAALPSPSPGEVEGNYIVSSPNDADLGEQQILKRTEGYQPFVVSASIPFYWTSNVALTNSGEQSDFLVSPVVAIAYQPQIAKDVFAYVSVRQQMFYYGRLTEFDFGSFDVEVGITYTVRQIHDLVLHIGYDNNRLTDKNSFDDFFANNIFAFSAEMPFRISRAQQLTAGFATNISMAGDPQGPRRHEFDWYAAYSAQVTRALNVGANVRLSLYDYVQTDRLDFTESVSLGATYSITKLISASALLSFSANQSNHSVFDYQVFDGGGAVSFSIRF
jgi:hypothetical protein